MPWQSKSVKDHLKIVYTRLKQKLQNLEDNGSCGVEGWLGRDPSCSFRDEPRPLLHDETQLSEFLDIVIMEEGYTALHKTKYQKSVKKEANTTVQLSTINSFPTFSG